MPPTPALAFLFNEGSGTSTVDEIEALAGTLQVGASFAGIGIDITGAGYVSAARASDSPFLGAITLVWIGNADTLGGGTLRHLMGKHASNGATQNPFDFYLDAGKPTLVRAHNTDYKVWQSSSTVTAGVRTMVSCVTGAAVDDTVTFYIDDAAVGGTGSGTAGGSPTGSGADLRIGRRADGATQMDGQVEAVLLFGEALTADDIADLWDNPEEWEGSGVGGARHHYAQLMGA